MPPPLPTPPATLADFKLRYKRDFLFGEGFDTVQDTDVTNAMQDAMSVFNAKLFSVADGWKAFLTLTAHSVRTNIEASGGLQAKPEGLGVLNQSEQLLASAGVSGVNKAYVEPPEWVKRFPLLQQLWGTSYGQQYVMMVQPKLVGHVNVVSGPRDVGALGSPSVPFTDY